MFGFVPIEKLKVGKGGSHGGGGIIFELNGGMENLFS